MVVVVEGRGNLGCWRTLQWDGVQCLTLTLVAVLEWGGQLILVVWERLLVVLRLKWGLAWVERLRLGMTSVPLLWRSWV